MSEKLIRNSEGWLAMKRLIEEKISKAQAMLEDPSDIERTNLLRGEIGAYRQMIRDVEEVRTDHPGQPVSYGQ
jgi:hypothetical protein